MTSVEKLLLMLDHPQSSVTEAQKESLLSLLFEVPEPRRERVLEQIFFTLALKEDWRQN